MQAVAAIIGAGGQGAQGGSKPTPIAAPTQAPIAPGAPGAPGQPGNGFGSAMLPAETKDSFAGTPAPYKRSGFGAGIDTAARIAEALKHPGQALVERMAGDPQQAGTFAQEHPEMMGIVKGLFD